MSIYRDAAGAYLRLWWVCAGEQTTTPASSFTGSSEEVAGQVKKHGRGKTKGIDPVQDPAMALNHMAIVLNATVALDG